MVFLLGHWVDLVLVLSVALIGLGVCYGLTMLVMSRREPSRTRSGPLALTAPKTVVFVLPCLNEDRVLGTSLERLLEFQHPRMKVLVVDDGSSDATARIVTANTDPRVQLLQRALPNAQQGKGQALNAAFAHIVSGAVVPFENPDDVLVCVVDADGRLEPHTLEDVVPRFDDPMMGAIQIGVRINNRGTNLLARMQDFEFVLYTEIFQRGRRHLGSVGLGGNGQFVRLSALMSLGDAPWSRSLTEDLDLGVRLLMAGWKTDFSARCAVHQQGLVSVGRWVKQRTRWFQGHLQSWPLVPSLLKHTRGAARVDLLYHLTSPFLLLVTSLLSVAFVLWGLDLVVSLLLGHVAFSWWWVSAYLFAFGPALLFGAVYSRVEGTRGWSRLRSLVLPHLYVGYAFLWFVAGWRAVWRVLTRQGGWSKTDRTVEDVAARLDSAPGHLLPSGATGGIS